MLDAQRAEGETLGPLHGIPILVKDNIATADEMGTRAGSYALQGATVPRDSGVAAKLRKAGAIILGKTNLSEWSSFRSSNSTSGWSAIGGQTYGAYYEGQSPSGSSSGSAVASSLGLASASLGTETSGSIVIPCSVGSLACIKPTVGLTSRDLVIPISQRQDTVGPMARTIKDAAHVLEAIAGPDPNDNYTSAYPFYTVPSYTRACTQDALKDKRIGIPRNLLDNEEAAFLVSVPALEAFEAAVEVMRSAGATIVEDTNFTSRTEYVQSEAPLTVLAADFLADLPNLYLSELEQNPADLQDLVDLNNFTQEIPAEQYPERNTEIWDNILEEPSFGNTDPRFWSAYQKSLELAGPQGLTGALNNFSLDAIVLPSDASPLYPAILGTPIVTVPLGYFPSNTSVEQAAFGNVNITGPNLPFGLSFLGPDFSEQMLIGLAYDFEQRTKVRDQVQPRMLPTTELVDIVVESQKAKR